MRIEIVGIDIGNITSVITTKEGTTSVESRMKLAEEQQKDFYNENVFTTNDTTLIVGEGNFENDYRKFEKDNFIPMIHYLLGNYTFEDNLKVVLGVPAGQYNTYKDIVKDLVLKNNKVNITLGKDTKVVKHILDVKVVPEGYGIYKLLNSGLLNPGVGTIVIDIGGGTTDIAVFSKEGRFIDSNSIDTGLLDMYRISRDKLKTIVPKVSLEDTRMYFDGVLKLLNNEDFDFRSEAKKTTFVQIYNELKGLYPGLSQMNIVISGGGAKVFGATFKKFLSQAIVVNDIELNSKGFYAIGGAIWNAKN